MTYIEDEGTTSLTEERASMEEGNDDCQGKKPIEKSELSLIINLCILAIIM